MLRWGCYSYPILDDVLDLGDLGIFGGGGDDGLQTPIYDDADDDNLLTNAKVSKYSFCERLTHYMVGVKINQQNHKAVELVFLVKAGIVIQIQ